MFRGHPQRIWRGRAVESLRSIDPGTFTTMATLRKRVLTDHTDDEAKWFDTLIAALVRAGQVTRSGQKVRLAD